MKIISFFLVFVAVFVPKSWGATKFMELQSAGLMGAVHLSYGATVNKRHNFSAGLGYVPQLSYHDDMLIASIKYRYQPDIKFSVDLFDKKWDWYPLSASIALIQGNDDDLYDELPSYIPNGYYLPTSRRVVFGFQSNLVYQNKYEAYWEWSVLDVGMINYLRNYDFYKDNYDYGGLAGIVSYGVGIRVRL